MKQKNLKKITAILIAAVLILSFCGCTKKEAETNRLEEIKSRGYLTVCMEPYFAPYEFIDSSKSSEEQYVGIDVEIAKVIAEKLGVELRIVPLEFGAVLTGIAEGKYDLAISALAYSPVRAENMNMSNGYYFDETEGYGLLVRNEDVDKYTTDASLVEAVLVTQSGSVQEGFVNEQVTKCKELKLVSSMQDGFLMVLEGKADACACDIGNAKLYAAANPGVTIANEFRFTYDKSTQGTRIGIPKGEDELTDFVNAVIEELISQGKIEGWYKEYSDYAATLGL